LYDSKENSAKKKLSNIYQKKNVVGKANSIGAINCGYNSKTLFNNMKIS